GDEYSVPRLLSRLPKDRAIKVAREAAVSTVAWSPYVSTEVADTLAAAEPVEREGMWRQLAAELKSLKRADLVARSAGVLPLFTGVGGEAAVDDLARSLIAVANWWR